MKFDLNWFTTIPGLLITGGVLLLVIALIIFIITSVRGKKNKNIGEDAVNTQTQVQSQVQEAPVTATAVQAQPVGVDNNVQQMGMVQPQAGTIDVSSINAVQPAPLNTVTPTDVGMVNLNVAPAPTIPMESVATSPVMPEVQRPSVNPVESVMPTPDEMMAVQQALSSDAMQSAQPVSVQPVVSEVQVAPVTSNEILSAQTPSVEISTQQVPGVEVVNSAPTVEVINTPSVEPVSMQPVVDVNSNGVIPNQTANVVPTLDVVNPSDTAVVSPVDSINVTPDVPVLDVNPVIENNVVSQDPVSIYGGVSPVVPNVTNDINQPHQIYGGANPLENTQSVPIVNIANENSYVAQENVAPLQPTVNVTPQYTATPVAPTFVNMPQESASVVLDQVPPVAQPQVQPVQPVMPQYAQQPVIQPINQPMAQQQVGIQ